jgi:hypothetical protein
MYLIVLTGIILLMLGLIILNSQVSIAKTEESNSSDKSKSDSNNQATTPTDDKQTNPTNDQNGDSTNMPTIGNVVIPLQQGDMVTVTTCSNGSDKTNDQICTAEQTNQQETVVQQQNKVTPHMTQPVHTGYLDNSLNTISTQDKDIKDNGGQSSGTNSNSYSDNELTIQEDKNNFSGKNLGSESRFIIMQQDNEKVGLFQIISNEDSMMSVNILPKTIRPVESFDSTAEALSWISEYDNRSN